MFSSRAFWLTAPVLVVLACSGTDKQEPQRPEAKPTSVEIRDDAFNRVADDYVEAARASEPKITALIQTLAAEKHVELDGIEHRLKSRKSVLRKLHLQAGPTGEAQDVELNDTLRYTFVIDDDPPGTHTSAVATILRSLEESGQLINKVKNYWPAGDNYSGVNSVLQTPSGLLWELQFHTNDSLRVKFETRAQYEELREAGTPLARKQLLFDEITAAWNTVPIPLDALTPQSLHASEEIINRPRP
jgi:hypothetical protein